MGDKRRSYLVLVLTLILLGALYVVPKIVQGYREAFAKGAEIREQQGR